MFGWRHACSVLVLGWIGLPSATAGGYPIVWWSHSCYPPPAPAIWVIPAPGIYAPSFPLAVATPAPPSKTNAESANVKKLEMPPADKPAIKPPPGSSGPTVIELRSTPPGAGLLGKDRCRVGFWNASGKDVTLIVGGKAQMLPRDRAVTFEVPREFVWQVDQQPAHTERVADDVASIELVIR